jgi:hypothetical protein
MINDASPGRHDSQHTDMLSASSVDRIIDLRTMHLGSDELVPATRTPVERRIRGADIAATIDDAKPASARRGTDGEVIHWTGTCSTRGPLCR